MSNALFQNIPGETPTPIESLPTWLYVVIYLLGLLLVSLPNIVALFRAIKTTPFDVKKLHTDTHISESDYAENLQKIASGATAENLGLRTELTHLRNEFDKFTLDHNNEIINLVNKYDEEIKTIRATYDLEILSLRTRYDKEIADLKEAHTVEMAELKKSLLASQAEAKAWREYSSRLIAQMHAEMPDVIPVPFEPRKSKSKEIGE